MHGGTVETQEMREVWPEKNIVSDIDIITMQKIKDAYQTLLKSDVKYSFVIDMASKK
jgi:D-arabinose 1-dehydrogenase-like Zn-dependent alcohol dehydrogenase